MENRSEELKQYLQPGKHIHLVGIGGVSMRPLGLVLKGMGMIVTGSDMNASVSTDELIAKGIQVTIGHREENVHGADCEEMKTLTPDDLQYVISANEDLVSKLWFEVADYDGWGESIYLHIEFTEKAMQAARGTKIPIELFFEKNGVRTASIALEFFIGEVVEDAETAEPTQATDASVEQTMQVVPRVVTTKDNTLRIVLAALCGVELVALSVAIILNNKKYKKGKGRA